MQRTPPRGPGLHCRRAKGQNGGSVRLPSPQHLALFPVLNRTPGSGGRPVLVRQLQGGVLTEGLTFWGRPSDLRRQGGAPKEVGLGEIGGGEAGSQSALGLPVRVDRGQWGAESGLPLLPTWMHADWHAAKPADRTLRGMET